MALRQWSDDEIVRLVWDYRLTNGACTLRDLAAATGMGRSGLHQRVLRLVSGGKLAMSETWGSIRAADEVMMRRRPDGKLESVR